MNDSNFPEPMIVVGGNSRSGRAVRARLAGLPILALVRGVPKIGERSIADYADPPIDIDLGNATIVICAGAVDGTREELWRANVSVPKAWARRGIEGGARRLIQISSFSIFGGAEAIDSNTPVAPDSLYGESKLGAELCLQELAGDKLAMTMLRVPILVGSGDDKLAKLVGLAKRTGLAICAPWPAPRSMLPYDGLARSVENIFQDATTPGWQAKFAADPEPFTAQMMVNAAVQEGRPLRTMAIPASLLHFAKKGFPGLYTSLFRPSLLDPNSNLLADGAGFVRLDATLRTMLRY